MCAVTVSASRRRAHDEGATEPQSVVVRIEALPSEATFQERRRGVAVDEPQVELAAHLEPVSGAARECVKPEAAAGRRPRVRTASQ